jgi:hypothetical protein
MNRTACGSAQDDAVIHDPLERRAETAGKPNPSCSMLTHFPFLFFTVSKYKAAAPEGAAASLLRLGHITSSS